MGYEARFRRKVRRGWLIIWSLTPAWKKALLKAIWFVTRDDNHEKIVRVMQR